MFATLKDLLLDELGGDYIDCIEGNVNQYGGDGCNLSNRGGSIYGFIVSFENDQERDAFFDLAKKNSHTSKRINDINDWKKIELIDGDYYPLYWGKDVNAGFRIFEHTKSIASSWTIQLSARDEMKLCKEVKYCCVLCKNDSFKKHEDNLHNKYKDLYKTSIKSKS